MTNRTTLIADIAKAKGELAEALECVKTAEPGLGVDLARTYVDHARDEVAELKAMLQDLDDEGK